MPIKYYGSPPPTETRKEASKSAIKADIMTLLRDIIHHRGWTQAQAAKQLKLTQPRVSYIIRGKISEFSLDRLFSILDGLGYEVRFSSPGVEGGVVEIEVKDEVN